MAGSEPNEYASLDEFLQANGAKRKIKRVLIANNGNAAIKFAMSVRQWCLETFNNAHEIELVGLVTPEDENSNAEYISYCDFIERVPGGSNNYNYASIDVIVECANQFHCDAVWPGWGHASENEELPRMLSAESNAIWIGPTSETMVAVGCKIASTIVAQSLDIPVVPWSGSAVKVSCAEDKLAQVTAEHIRRACIRDVEHLYQLIDEDVVTFPFMLKAAAGGGGKGIRIVEDREKAANCYHMVSGEVQGSLIFAMNCVTNCRHLEVQILGDEYGLVVPCGARDCTIQRRHQKIIEEGPPVCADSELIEQLMESAAKLCRAVNYYSAGTVEFLFDIEKHEYYFLEVNARLQVEHVVTELMMDANLPVAQLQIAMGLPLHKIEGVKQYMERRSAKVAAEKHVIASRIVAENSENNFQPTTGAIQELNFGGSSHVWGYFSVTQGGKVHQYCDSQIGHIFAVGKTRTEARKHLLNSLRTLIIRGEIWAGPRQTDRALHVRPRVSGEN
uniref:Acetyl-CoA carboxylase-like n=1 Tax=Dermatophagoides pteronyssinus TaxID=6956 RepID=A0A6P6Y4H1_DERPT|nr:acetyl-CoA carboxylase-like [Dermatophagoides pteronyssinus]